MKRNNPLSFINLFFRYQRRGERKKAMTVKMWYKRFQQSSDDTTFKRYKNIKSE